MPRVPRTAIVMLALVLAASSCGATTTTVVMTGDATASTADALLVEFQASPAFLAQAAERVDATDTYRFEIKIETTNGFGGFPTVMGSRTAPLGFGEVAGARSKVVMDLGAFVAPIAELDSLVPSGMLEIATITDGDVFYLHAPFIQAMAGAFGGSQGAGSGSDWTQVVGDGWGRIELQQLVGPDVDVLDSIGNLGGLQAVGAEQVLAILHEVAEVSDGGQSEVRGVATRVATAAISMGDLFRLSGQDLEAYRDIDPDIETYFDGSLINIEVHVDDAGLVRRVEYVTNLGDFGVEGAESRDEFSTWQQIDFLDFGEPVVIEIPDSVDITQDFLAILELGG